MSGRRLRIITMTATPFREDGAVDEEALRVHLRRIIAARNELYLPGPGAGEGHTLGVKELRRIYEIGVEESRGKVDAYAALREGRSAAGVLEVAREAVAAGVDAVQMYQVEGGHGMIPTPREQERYWTTLLEAIRIPVAISIDYHAQFKAPTSLLRTLHERYPHFHAVNIVGASAAYFMELREGLPETVQLTHGNADVLEFASLGATAFHGPEGNIVPFICRSLADDYLAGDLKAAAARTLTLRRFHRIVNQWAPSTARWVKLALRALGLGNGVLREPYLLPGSDDERRMKAALDGLRLMELEAEAAATMGARVANGEPWPASL